MPELPEVEVIRRSLEKKIKQKKVKKVIVRNRNLRFKIPKNFENVFKNQKIIIVDRFSKYLILIKECSKDAQKYIPDYLDEIVEKNLNCLGSMKTPENNLPLFNGGLDNKIDEYLKYIETLNYKFKKNKNLIGNIQIIKNKKNYVFFDVGEPPKKNYSLCNVIP